MLFCNLKKGRVVMRSWASVSDRPLKTNTAPLRCSLKYKCSRMPAAFHSATTSCSCFNISWKLFGKFSISRVRMTRILFKGLIYNMLMKSMLKRAQKVKNIDFSLEIADCFGLLKLLNLLFFIQLNAAITEKK